MNAVSPDVMRGIRQCRTLEDRLLTGAADPTRVRGPLQNIIEEKFDSVTPAVPSWYIAPERQLARVHRLNSALGWGFEDRDFPVAPRFTPRTSTDVQLLAVYLPPRGDVVSGVQRTVGHHLAVIRQQLVEDGCSYWQWDGLKFDPSHLRRVGGIEHKPGLRWLGYDYAANHSPKNGHTVKSLWDYGNLFKATAASLAASEVLSALMLFREYGPSMDGDKVPYVNLPGYQFYYPCGWTSCLDVDWDAGNHRLNFGAARAGDSRGGWASPTVREC